MCFIPLFIHMRSNTFKDETNNRYGKLLVLGKAPKDLRGSTYTMWKCQCDCGNVIVTRGNALRSGISKSCGCSRPGVSKRLRKRPFEWLYNKLKRQCTFFKRECTLTYDEFLPFTKTNSCAYCGEPVEWQEYSSRYEKNGKYNLDRINNKQGYIKNNCVVCCGACNFLKGPRTKEEFLSRVDKIYSHQHKLLA